VAPATDRLRVHRPAQVQVAAQPHATPAWLARHRSAVAVAHCAARVVIAPSPPRPTAGTPPADHRNPVRTAHLSRGEPERAVRHMRSWPHSSVVVSLLGRGRKEGDRLGAVELGHGRRAAKWSCRPAAPGRDRSGTSVPHIAPARRPGLMPPPASARGEKGGTRATGSVAFRRCPSSGGPARRTGPTDRPRRLRIATARGHHGRRRGRYVARLAVGRLCRGHSPGCRPRRPGRGHVPRGRCRAWGTPPALGGRSGLLRRTAGPHHSRTA